jgi:Putative DnaT-like ssDNA binding protein
MALIVEDGTGMKTAESYLAVADADQYHRDHHNVEWADQVLEAKEAALRYATWWLDGQFRWIGRLTKFDQALGWPRILGIEYVSAFDEEGRLVTGVPMRVQHAVAEIALTHLKTVPLNRVVKPDGAITRGGAGSAYAEFNQYRTRAEMEYVQGLLKNLYVAGNVGGGLRTAQVARG